MMTLLVLGSPALAMAYIASGRIHGYFNLKLHLWDIAAAAVILREAGGVVTNLQWRLVAPLRRCLRCE